MVQLAATWTMSEFLVLAKFRRTGVGTAAARAVFARHPGPRAVHEISGNQGAVEFWRHAIPTTFSEVTDEGGTTQRFEMPA